MIKVLDEDLLNAEEQFIAHQCNCVSRYETKLATQIFKKYTHIYKERTKPSVPGSILVTDERVIHMFAQIYPGRPDEFSQDRKDNNLWRHGYFTKCLSLIADIHDIKSVAFQEGIGCGDWKDYYQLLRNFEAITLIPTTIYRRPK
mgnify:CR=1 FL=1|tara:strand:- start:6396 stop:6830 length:435 start_codon:yes stop_codon:yes gene_type:complete